jgi:apolipoprotein N-acyltransferase
MMNEEKTDGRKGRRAWWWLLLGAALIVLVNLRWGLAMLAWVAPLPVMRYLRLAPGWRPRAALALVLPIAWTLAVLKIVTHPLPPAAALGFGVPFGFLFLVPYLAWDWLRRRADDWRAALAFPSLMVGVEWAQAHFTPFGSWGAAAYTQLDDLALLQVTSLFGTAGVAWIVYGVAAALDRAIAYPAERRRWVGAAVGAVALAHLWGALRIAVPAKPTRVVRAAAVGTDSTAGGLPLPTAEENARIEDAIFERTRTAARSGAKLVVWTEGATVVEHEREEALLARASEAARELEIDLVVAFIAPVSLSPLLYENEYVWLRPDGRVDHRYHKHEPVPGEPAVRGTEPHRAVETSFGRASGAICYDYDFPSIAARHADLGIDLVALPSSDWQGIDPIHTQMAAVRAIEGGFSIVRSTRMGLSAGIDPYGRLRSWMSANESPERIMLVTLPATSVPTLYARIGDSLAYASLAFVAYAVGMALAGRRRDLRRALSISPSASPRLGCCARSVDRDQARGVETSPWRSTSRLLVAVGGRHGHVRNEVVRSRISRWRTPSVRESRHAGRRRELRLRPPDGR